MGLLSAIGGAAQIAAPFIERNWSKRDVQNARDHDRFMSDTAHQREVKDLMAAGLNPTLSAGGSGASTPASHTPTAPQIDMPKVMSTFFQQSQLQNDETRLAIEGANSAANVAKTLSDTRVNEANSAAGIAKTLSDTELNKMKKILLQKGMPRAHLEGEASNIIEDALKYLKSNALKPKVPKHDEPNSLKEFRKKIINKIKGEKK